MSTKKTAIVKTAFGQVEQDFEGGFGATDIVYLESFPPSSDPYRGIPEATAEKPYAYYDESQPLLISPDEATGKLQKLDVRFTDPDFTRMFHYQWVYESQIGVYKARGFQFVRPEWVGSAWTHALTAGAGIDHSDKLRAPVTIADEGHIEYNVLMFIKRELFDRMVTAGHNEFNKALTARDDGLSEMSKQNLDAKWIREHYGN